MAVKNNLGYCPMTGMKKPGNMPRRAPGKGMTRKKRAMKKMARHMMGG